jgi:purine catabolism regulator
MKLTVSDALRLPPLSLGNLVAGQGGIDKEIQSITVIEVPDRSEFLQPHLLAISSMCVIADNLKEQLALIRLLNKYEGSGLCQRPFDSPHFRSNFFPTSFVLR